MYAYLFEARSIQQYILETGKLKDMVGASHIVDHLCQYEGGGDLIGSVLEVLNLIEGRDIRFSRRAGGAFVALLENADHAKALRNLWTLTVSHYAPGLEWVDALKEGISDVEAVDKGFEALAIRRNQPAAFLPEAGPFVRRAPHTGRAAAKPKKGEWLDSITLAKRARNNEESDIGWQFLPLTEDGKSYCWVRSLEASEDEGEDRCMPPIPDAEPTLGVIHADGNGLGIALKVLQNAAKERSDYQQIYWRFSVAIACATKLAVQAATKEVLIPAASILKKQDRYILPARPLVLGGDDLTLIVRGDLALDYLASFIRHFEGESEKQLASLRETVPKLPKMLTACGGVAFIRLKQPFAQAYALAESLCAYAKMQSGGVAQQDLPKPSSIAFYRVSTSHIGEYGEILEHVETLLHNGVSYQMTLGAYDVNEQGESGLPRLCDLQGLQKLLAGIEGTAARQLLTILQQTPHLATEKYGRWREVMGKRDTASLVKFDAYLERLGIADSALPFTKESGGIRKTPLGDLHALKAVLPRTGNQEAKNDH